MWIVGPLLESSASVRLIDRAKAKGALVVVYVLMLDAEGALRRRGDVRPGSLQGAARCDCRELLERQLGGCGREGSCARLP